MSMRTAPNYSLLVSALLLSAGCASSPSTPSASRGQNGGAGGAVPTATTQPATASSGAAADPAAVAAPAGGGPGAAAAAGANGPGQTSDERRAAIDKQLNDSLGSFDAELRTEQQRVAQERDARRATAAGSATVDGQGADKSGDSPGTASTEAPQEDADRPGTSGRHPGPGRAKPRDPSGDLKSEKASKKPDDNAGNGASAREIPDGSDDDVVARRLRQAAQQETDPELKEKLWQEYIDYKRNAQGK
jgi:hypothetical protein